MQYDVCIGGHVAVTLEDKAAADRVASAIRAETIYQGGRVSVKARDRGTTTGKAKATAAIVKRSKA